MVTKSNALNDLKILLDELEKAHLNLSLDNSYYIDGEGNVSLATDYSALEIVRNHLMSLRREGIYFKFDAKKDYFNAIKKELSYAINQFLNFIDSKEYSINEKSINKLVSFNFPYFYSYFFRDYYVNDIIMDYNNKSNFQEKLNELKNDLYDNHLNINITLSSGYIFVTPKGKWFDELKKFYRLSDEELLSKKIRIKVIVDFYIYVRSINLF